MLPYLLRLAVCRKRELQSLGRGAVKGRVKQVPKTIVSGFCL